MGRRLLAKAMVTALGLAVLIVVFSKAGGAQFNPVVTAADWILGRRTARRYRLGQALAVMACQIAGAIAGAALVATGGLLFVIVALARTGRLQHVAWAVGAWIGAA